MAREIPIDPEPAGDDGGVEAFLNGLAIGRGEDNSAPPDSSSPEVYPTDTWDLGDGYQEGGFPC